MWKKLNENLKATIPNTDMINKTQLESVEVFSRLSIMATNGARFACDMKSSIIMAKTAFNKKTDQPRGLVVRVSDY